MPSHDINDDLAAKTETRRPAGVKVIKNERRPALVSLRGELMAVPIPLERNQVIIGRALEADVRINDLRASRLHARINSDTDAQTGETVYSITDLGSTNGTLLNGE